MKLNRIAFICAAFLVTSVASLAQPPQPPHPEHDPVGEALFPPELIMQNQKAIGLDDNQKASIRGELGKAQGHFTEMQWQLQDAMETLASLLRPDTVEESQVLAQLDKVLNLERDIKRTQIGLLLRLKNKLTPDQQARLRALRK